MHLPKGTTSRSFLVTEPFQKQTFHYTLYGNRTPPKARVLPPQLDLNAAEARLLPPLYGNQTPPKARLLPPQLDLNAAEARLLPSQLDLNAAESAAAAPSIGSERRRKRGCCPLNWI